MITRIFSDPRVINYVLMALFLLNAARWAYEKKWCDSLYWIASFLITVAVTFK